MVSAPFWAVAGTESAVPEGYKGVLTLWQVDGFEGGSGSRSAFLNGRAIEFEKSHPGVLVSVQTYTCVQVRQKLLDGDRFDLISFPVGTGQYVRRHLAVYDGAVNVRDDLLEGGKLGGDIYAVPWTLGGYALCAFDETLDGGVLTPETLADGKYTLGVGFWDYGNPFAALETALPGGVKAWNGETATSYGAYESFLSGRCDVLLATQRDISRLKLRQSQGRLESLSVYYLGGYTDLTQYIGYADNGGGRGDYAKEFIQYLTSDAAQKKLTAIEMFSAALDIYSSGMHGEMQRALDGRLTAVNVFTDGEILARKRGESMEAWRRD